MLVSFNPNISYNNKAQCRKQTPAFKQNPLCEVVEIAGTIQIRSVPSPKGNRGLGLITDLGDFLAGITRNPKNKGKTVIVDAKKLDEACEKADPPFVAELLRDTFADQGIVAKNITQ